MTENRKHKRARVIMKVYYSYGAHSDRTAKVIDISKGGMYLETGYAPEVEGYLLASLDAEDFGKIIWVQGRIVRKTNIGMGIMFTKIDEAGLNNLLTSRSALF
jgi:hypothetical protein